MKISFGAPSIKKSIFIRASSNRYAKHSLGLMALCGYGWFFNPLKSLNMRVYNCLKEECSVDLAFVYFGAREVGFFDL